MAQKPIFKSGKKKPAKAPAANRHGRLQKVQKGNLQRGPKSAAAKKVIGENREISKTINKRIEEQTAAAAAHDGKKLKLLKANIEALKVKKKSQKRTAKIPTK